jgi:hypothetical protein
MPRQAKGSTKMIAESQIREKLGRYLRRDLSLDQFEDWIAQQSWNMHKDSNEAAQKLASAIELRLAEHSSGHLSESALREELRQFANPPVVQISFGAAQQRPVEGPANNVTAQPRAQVAAFNSTVRLVPVEGPSLGGAVSSGREQLVAFG